MKQLKIDTRLKTLPQWAGHCLRCIEAMSSMVKTVKGHVAAKTSPQWAANVFKA
ncbi:hypothetical protein MUO79_01085 [Candidatus Bathyarchaeota archaeon]|nr:hypothetical protein [Candidatus Bathyarchaeota archaeon]